SKLHDVALVHQSHALAIKPDRVADRAVYQSDTTGVAHRLDSDSYSHIGRKIFGADVCPELARSLFCPEPDLLELLWKFFGQKIENLLRFRRAGRVFNPGINVFRVLAENNHVHLLRVFHGRGDAPEVLDRSQTDVEVEQLPQGDV